VTKANQNLSAAGEKFCENSKSNQTGTSIREQEENNIFGCSLNKQLRHREHEARMSRKFELLNVKNGSGDSDRFESTFLCSENLTPHGQHPQAPQ
jgi:hypothetical protein